MKRIVLEDFANHEFTIKVKDGTLIIEAEGLVITKLSDITKKKVLLDNGTRGGG